MRPLSPAQGLELFDAARGAGEALQPAVHLDLATLRAAARAGVGPGCCGAGARSRRRAGAERGGFARRLAQAPEQERAERVLELVRGKAAVVLGHASSQGSRRRGRSKSWASTR